MQAVDRLPTQAAAGFKMNDFDPCLFARSVIGKAKHGDAAFAWIYVSITRPPAAYPFGCANRLIDAIGRCLNLQSMHDIGHANSLLVLLSLIRQCVPKLAYCAK